MTNMISGWYITMPMVMKAQCVGMEAVALFLLLSFLNIFENKTNFMAIDGLHEAEVNGDLVKLKMIDVEDINTFPEYTVMNTGSPHYVAFVEHVEDMDVYLEGKK